MSENSVNAWLSKQMFSHLIYIICFLGFFWCHPRFIWQILSARIQLGPCRLHDHTDLWLEVRGFVTDRPFPGPVSPDG